MRDTWQVPLNSVEELSDEFMDTLTVTSTAINAATVSAGTFSVFSCYYLTSVQNQTGIKSLSADLLGHVHLETGSLNKIESSLQITLSAR